MERQFKGIFIPAEIWEAKDLTWTEKIVLMEIDSFTTAERDCFVSDEYIGELVGCSPRTARAIVSKLIRLGYVVRTRFDGRKRYLCSSIFAGQGGKICRAGWQNLPDTNSKITSNNINNNIINNNQHFIAPTIAEVRAYCERRGNGIDAEEFVAFYASKGWKVGTAPMKDWRAAVITWEKSRRRTSDPRTTSKPRQETLTDYYRRVMRELNPDNDGNTTDDQ